MVTRVELKGFDQFAEYTENIDPNGPPIYFFFSGSKLTGGNSWCPDCVEGSYDDFTKFVEKLPSKGPNVYFLFTGKKKENGRSWCIYCQMAEPVVQAYLNELTKSLIFAYVDVGDMKTWKDPNCSFRTDSRTKLMVIPTILKWKGVQRLEGSQCNKRELLQMMFEEEE